MQEESLYKRLEKEYETLREVKELIWEMELWAREGKEGKRIRDKIWKELVDKIQEHRKENPH